jgi:hypothetical protein
MERPMQPGAAYLTTLEWILSQLFHPAALASGSYGYL